MQILIRFSWGPSSVFCEVLQNGLMFCFETGCCREANSFLTFLRRSQFCNHFSIEVRVGGVLWNLVRNFLLNLLTEWDSIHQVTHCDFS